MSENIRDYLVAEFSHDYLERRRRFVAPSTIGPDSKIILERAKGTRLWDVAGKEYIDFCASVAVAGLGHGHPAIAAIQAFQQDRLDFVEGTGFDWCFRAAVDGRSYEISPAALAERILRLMFPGVPEGETRFIYEITGATADNAAAKLALKARPGRHVFASFERAFHGRHGYALEATNSKPIQKADYPLSGLRWHTIPFPDSFKSRDAAIRALREIPQDGCNAFFYEPLQGEGGFRWADVITMLDDVLAVARERGFLLICDEIQTGLGRLGKWFGHQYCSVLPDIVVCGKAFGGGSVPISGVGYRRSIFGDRNDDDVLKLGWHSGTFPAYPKGVASAILFLDIVERERLLDRVPELSLQLMRVLSKHAGSSPLRRTGFGLMQGLEFCRNRFYADAAAYRNTVLRALRDAEPVGIITLGAGVDHLNPTIRFSPPYIATQFEIEYLDEALDRAFSAARLAIRE